MARPKAGKEIDAMKTVAMRINEAQKKSLERLVRRRKSSLSVEIREAIDAHIERYERKEG